MNWTMRSRAKPGGRFLALFLALLLSLPNPAWALRTRNAGLEEPTDVVTYAIEKRLRDGEPPVWIAPDLWQGLTEGYGGKIPRIVEAQGDLDGVTGRLTEELKRSLKANPLVKPLPPRRWFLRWLLGPPVRPSPPVAVILDVEYPGREDHILVIDEADQIIQGGIEALAKGEIVLSEYEFILYLSVHPKENLVHLHNISLGRRLKLRGKGLMSATFRRIEDRLGQLYGGMRISGVASSLIAEHWLKDHFTAGPATGAERKSLAGLLRISSMEPAVLLIGKIPQPLPGPEGPGPESPPAAGPSTGDSAASSTPPLRTGLEEPPATVGLEEGEELSGRGAGAGGTADPGSPVPRPRPTGLQPPNIQTRRLSLRLLSSIPAQSQGRPQHGSIQSRPRDEHLQPERLVPNKGPQYQPPQDNGPRIGQEPYKGSALSAGEPHPSLVYHRGPNAPTAISPVAAGLEEVETDLSVDEARQILDGLANRWGFTHLSGLRIAAVTPEVVAESGLEELIGHPVKMGDVRLVVVPREPGRMDDLLARDLMSETNPVIVVQSYGGLEEKVLDQFESKARTVDFTVLPRVVLGRLVAQDPFRRIIAHLAGLEENAIQEEEVMAFTQALGKLA